MNSVLTFYERQYGNYNGRNYDIALGRLSVHERDDWNGIEPSTESTDFNPEPPIFTAKFANCENYKHMLAIANEDGKIALQDTNRTTGTPAEKRTLQGEQCHFNAVFDLEWMPGDMKFVSASGDNMARLWTVKHSGFELTRCFIGHTRSVKTAAFRHTDSSVFATGGRDGAILIWDTRATSNVGAMPRADNIIHRGHAGGPETPHSNKRRTRQTRQTPEMPANAMSSSITGLVFQDDNTLVSCGAGDGIIKVWDLRRNYTSIKREPTPKHSIAHPGTSTFKGFSNLMIDKSRLKLYVNCMDNSIYCYNLAAYSANPLMRYTGLRNSSFYIKASLSDDGQYLISGSGDEKAYIWNVARPEPLVVLNGHMTEVTCVAWSHAKDLRLVTCSDDARHKIWRIGPEHRDFDEELQYRGAAKRCQEYRPTSLKGRLKVLENTPRSLKRLIERNETTPSSGTAEISSNKRSFSEMMDDDDLQCYETSGSDQKRPNLETRARRLFSPCSTTSIRQLDQNATMSAIPEETETNLLHSPSKGSPKILLSPLSERLDRNTKSPETPNSSLQSCTTSGFFSPTLNLPNFVLNGEAPHLPTPSPKRKLKENVDWLTKIRKQKLMSTISNSQKICSQINSESKDPPSELLMSPRLQSLKSSAAADDSGNGRCSSPINAGNTAITTPKRRSSASIDSTQRPRTPTNRRNSEATILRFFSVTPTPRKPGGGTGVQTTCSTAPKTTCTTSK